jgi:hypothetical protein
MPDSKPDLTTPRVLLALGVIADEERAKGNEDVAQAISVARGYLTMWGVLKSAATFARKRVLEARARREGPVNKVSEREIADAEKPVPPYRADPADIMAGDA